MIDPHQSFPMDGVERLCFLKNMIQNPRIEVGEYTYYDDPDGVDRFERNVLYHFDFIGDKLIIGKFCQIAAGIKFIMNGANHSLQGFTTYPFRAFGDEWSEVSMDPTIKGDTIIGHDVWIGHAVTVMPGVNVGHGAVIASGSVVTSDVAPYTIVGGNPARLIRERFEPIVVDKLLALQWWNWPLSKITEHAEALVSADEALLDQL